MGIEHLPEIWFLSVCYRECTVLWWKSFLNVRCLVKEAQTLALSPAPLQCHLLPLKWADRLVVIRISFKTFLLFYLHSLLTILVLYSLLQCLWADCSYYLVRILSLNTTANSLPQGVSVHESCFIYLLSYLNKPSLLSPRSSHQTMKTTIHFRCVRVTLEDSFS